LGHGKTAGTPENVGHFSDKAHAFRVIVEDMHSLTGLIKAENPGLPVFLLGHSMGSMLARIYAASYGRELSGVLLTGTGGKSWAYLTLMIGVSKAVMLLRGGRYRSALLNRLYVDALNGPFKSEGNTGNEFISSDPAVVAAYAADGFCGTALSTEFFHELLWGTRAAGTGRVIRGFPKDLPLFIGAGALDTLGGPGLGMVKKDAERYRAAGLVDMEFHVYEGMRHEILNEKDKQRVYDDILAWLKKRAKAS
jgi:alpha-beta hydrolase superfamily lysophospholipase